MDLFYCMEYEGGKTVLIAMPQEECLPVGAKSVALRQLEFPRFFTTAQGGNHEKIQSKKWRFRPKIDGGSPTLFVHAGWVEGSMQNTLYPWGIASFIAYGFGFPITTAFITWKYRDIIVADQMLRQRGLGQPMSAPHE